MLVINSQHGERGYARTMALSKAVRAPMRVVSILPQNGSHNFPTRVREMPAALKRMNQQLTFPQDVVPRRHYKKTTLAAPHCGKAGHGTLRASGSEPAVTAGPRE